MRLSADQAADALTGLTADEKQELFALLVERDRRQSEIREDNREPLAAIAERARQEYASRTDDPTKYLAACDAHEAQLRKHLDEIRGAADDLDLAAPSLEQELRTWQRAVELAAADGYPLPGSRDFTTRRDDAEREPRPALPRATAMDVQYTRARESIPIPRLAPALVGRPWFAGSGKTDGPTFEDGI